MAAYSFAKKHVIEPKWECDECGDLYESEDDAQECCQPTIREVFVCPICTEHQYNERDAIDCCGFDPDGPPPPPTAEELEHAGQLRLEAF